MFNKKKYRPVSDKPDSNLAGRVPTANSEEFVPKPLDVLPKHPTDDSSDIYDFIPQLKSEKYK